jgi:hypothetical protein
MLCALVSQAGSLYHYRSKVASLNFDQWRDINPGVKLAYDEFFAGKPEQIVCLFGNQYNHAYFRKV